MSRLLSFLFSILFSLWNFDAYAQVPQVHDSSAALREVVVRAPLPRREVVAPQRLEGVRLHGCGQEKGRERGDAGLRLPAGFQDFYAAAEFSELDKAKPHGKVDSAPDEEDDREGEIPEDRDIRVGGQISGEVPEKIGNRLNPFAYRVDYIKDRLH